MSTSTNDGSPFGVLGVFLVMLGAGVVLDADWSWRGGALIALGAWYLWRAYDRPGKSGVTPR